MKLSEKVSIANKLYPNTDPEIRVAGSGGFLCVDDILPRSAYHDDDFFGNVWECGEFIVIETKMSLYADSP